MKLSEFEEKLRGVPDDKLRRMLEKSRKEGPEVAVKLILAEAGRRGMQDVGAPEPTVPESATALRFVSVEKAPAEAPVIPDADPPSPESRLNSEWLIDEIEGTHSGTLVKVLFLLAAIGGLLYYLYKYAGG